MNKVWSFKGSIKVPWSHVRGATHDPGIKDEPKGFRGPGLAQGKKFAGTFRTGGEKHFWNVSGYEDAVVIELTNEDFSRLILSIENPAQNVARINELAMANKK
ncbi:hypothetical protein QP994_05735 [Corynebacterium sp. MSK044]|nr:hypothetical protein [Corynebacterium sp. MSK044]MDK8797386.1 hypothetical protein [Corynebacterium sp. MSK044]